MTIPVAQPQMRPRDGDAGVSRVLVVDDEQYMCDVCARTLQRSGYEVVTTSDPQAAVQLLSNDMPFDLLLTDIKMPGMSGLDLAYLAHERDPAIAVIIMTGFASKENLQLSVQRGVADFLSKPFEVDELRLAVDQALNKRRLLQDSLRMRALERLLASSEALSSTLELQPLAATLLRLTMAQSGCRAGFVLLEQAATTVIASPQEGELLPAGRELARQASAQRQVVSGSDLPLCHAEGVDLHFGLAVALYTQGEVSGVLLLCDNRPTVLRSGVQEEIALLANHAGAALRNAALYSQLDEAYTRLQELDRLKGEFIAIASHELRTPLSIVLGYSMMLRDQVPNEQHRIYMQRVLENGQRIRDIVDDMVSLRHLETGESPLTMEPVVLQDVMRQAYEEMAPMASSRNQQMSLELPEASITFMCDKEKILLILGHLIANAVRFTPEGGVIWLRASTDLTPSLLPQEGKTMPRMPGDGHGPWVVVEVQDTGIGIPEREQLRIFQRFYQIADSLTRDHGGLGLGLALVRELIDLLGGSVWVTSQEGRGSTFSFALPCRHE